VKIEKKSICLDDYLSQLDFNNMSKDMLFSDLEDEDEDSSKHSSGEDKKTQYESPVLKPQKSQKKKSANQI
jgi:hypothetical protein